MWKIKKPSSPEKIREVVERYNITEAMAQILIHKGENYVDDFLRDKPLYDAWKLKNMDICVKRICDAITRKEKIRVCGDMDVDGITSTAIMVLAITDADGIADYDIPNRVGDGYGMNIRMVDEAIKDGINLIITVDNGIAQHSAITYARDNGIDVVVIDHHEVQYVTDAEGKQVYVLPDTPYIIDQKQPDETYPFRDICGAMLAYKVAQCIFTTLRIKRPCGKNLEELCALATVCDIMPLVEENRTIVKQGMKMMKNTSFLGLQKLIEETEINTDNLSTYHFGFIIGPCLNATGRLTTAKLGVELLLSEDEARVSKIAKECKELNEERKKLTTDGEKEALAIIEEQGLSKVIVLHLNKCSPSVAGIVAGRIKETFNRPVIILCNSPDDEAVVKGSGRSIPQYNMFEELTKHKDLLENFGGHEMAAGMSLKKDMVKVLAAILNKDCMLSNADFERNVTVDVRLPLHLITEKFIKELPVLEPYGEGNSKPVIAESNIPARKGFVMGKNRNMLRLKLEGSGRRIYTGVYFGDATKMKEYYVKKYGDKAWEDMMNGYDNPIKMTLSYEPQINEWNNEREIQIIIKDYC